MFELQITQTRHLIKPFRMEKNSKLNTCQKLRKYLSNVHKIRDAHIQCVNNHYAKFEYKGKKCLSYRLHRPDAILAFWKKICLSATPLKNKKLDIHELCTK